MFRAVLDTCALVPGRQRDFLLQLAAEETYAPLWSSGVLDELSDVLQRLNERRGRLDDSAARAHLLRQMERSFPGSTIRAPRSGDYSYDVQDPGDGHVVHAAIIGKADAIVSTDRRAGFAASTSLQAAGVEILTPAEFAGNTVAFHPRQGFNAIMEMSTRRKNPPEPPLIILEALRYRYGMQEVYDLLRPMLD